MLCGLVNHRLVKEMEDLGHGDWGHEASVTSWAMLLRPRCSSWLTDWLTVSQGVRGLFLLKCWNLWFFIVVWKGSLPVMQETERLPCSKNARFPGPIPWAPSPGRSQNISSFRIQGHCIFILIHFFSSSVVPGSEAGAPALPQVLTACVIRTLTWCLG